MKETRGAHFLCPACAVVFIYSLYAIYQGSALEIVPRACCLAAKTLPHSPFPIPHSTNQDRLFPSTFMPLGSLFLQPSIPSPTAISRTQSAIESLPADSAAEERREGLEDIIAQCEREYGVDRFLITAVIKVESNFNPGAVSPEGAQGLMQLMPDMAQEVGITDRLDPVQNISGGAIYLARQLQAFQGDLPLALAAYHAGPSTVRKHGGIPPYQVTHKFVDKVIFYQRHFQRGSNSILGR